MKTPKKEPVAKSPAAEAVGKKEPRTKRQPRQEQPRRKPVRWWHTAVQWVLWIFTAIAILGLLGACFGGDFNPNGASWLSLLVLSMPLWLGLWVLATVLDALWCRKALVFCILALIACANAIWNYFPLNVFPPSAAKYASCPKFTLLTYNIASFCDMTRSYPDGTNPTVSYILRTDADVVCLQETEVNLVAPFPYYHITPEQIDSVSTRYPYRLLYGGYLTVLSKYPVEAIHTPAVVQDQKYKWRAYPIGVFRLNIEGLPVTLFNVHLQSYGLSDHDKALYKNIAEGREIKSAAEGSVKKSLGEIRREIVEKVEDAAEKRADEANVLCNYIERFGGPNVIVAGDFNDVPGCYTLKRLADYRLREVYPRIGFGPMITFNADMFYFRIDHVLYRGALVPLRMQRGNIKYSDHYPLLTTFAVTAPEGDAVAAVPSPHAADTPHIPFKRE